eukprot:c31409_g1_i1 orf=198-386(+)
MECYVKTSNRSGIFENSQFTLRPDFTGVFTLRYLGLQQRKITSSRHVDAFSQPERSSFFQHW